MDRCATCLLLPPALPPASVVATCHVPRHATLGRFNRTATRTWCGPGARQGLRPPPPRPAASVVGGWAHVQKAQGY